MNQGVYEEAPLQIRLKPRVRTYREKSKRSGIQETTEQKRETRRKLLQQQKEEMQKPRIREILLKWLSDVMEDVDFTARTDDGRRYVLDRTHVEEKCVVHCEDGNFTMPRMAIVFQEEM